MTNSACITALNIKNDRGKERCISFQHVDVRQRDESSQVTQTDLDLEETGKWLANVLRSGRGSGVLSGDAAASPATARQDTACCRIQQSFRASFWVRFGPYPRMQRNEVQASKAHGGSTEMTGKMPCAKYIHTTHNQSQDGYAIACSKYQYDYTLQVISRRC